MRLRSWATRSGFKHVSRSLTSECVGFAPPLTSRLRMMVLHILGDLKRPSLSNGRVATNESSMECCLLSHGSCGVRRFSIASRLLLEHACAREREMARRIARDACLRNAGSKPRLSLFQTPKPRQQPLRLGDALCSTQRFESSSALARSALSLSNSTHDEKNTNHLNQEQENLTTRNGEERRRPRAIYAGTRRSCHYLCCCRGC